MFNPFYIELFKLKNGFYFKFFIIFILLSIVYPFFNVYFYQIVHFKGDAFYDVFWKQTLNFVIGGIWVFIAFFLDKESKFKISSYQIAVGQKKHNLFLGRLQLYLFLSLAFALIFIFLFFVLKYYYKSEIEDHELLKLFFVVSFILFVNAIFLNFFSLLFSRTGMLTIVFLYIY